MIQIISVIYVVALLQKLSVKCDKICSERILRILWNQIG